MKKKGNQNKAVTYTFDSSGILDMPSTFETIKMFYRLGEKDWARARLASFFNEVTPKPTAAAIEDILTGKFPVKTDANHSVILTFQPHQLQV